MKIQIKKEYAVGVSRALELMGREYRANGLRTKNLPDNQKTKRDHSNAEYHVQLGEYLLKLSGQI